MIDDIARDVKTQKISASLGEDFLTWLWFKTEINNGLFESSKNEVFTVALGDKVVVTGGEGEFKESAMSSGKNSTFKEAKEGLKTGKKVTSAKIIIEYNGEEWSFVIKSEDFSFSSFKTPKVSKKIQEDEDPDGKFFEKLYLMEKGLELFDELFKAYLKKRFDPFWGEELGEMRKWLKSD